MIYLDWAATAIPKTELITQAYINASATFANPSSVHPLGVQARALLEDARRRCAEVLCVPPETLYFTSGGSESNSLLLLSLLMRPAAGSIAISSLEHPSVREQAHSMEQCGWTVLSIPADKNGIITPQAVLKTLRSDTVLAAVMEVNNEIGVIQPIAEISNALAQYSAGKRPIHLHTDSVQALGKLPITRLALPFVHSSSMSAHKIGGPRGIGLLYAKQLFTGFIRGGAQEHSIRPGTENTAGACALAACLEETYHDFSKKYQTAQDTAQYFLQSVREIPECRLIPAARTADDSRFSPWIIQCGFKGIPAEVMMRCLSDHGICVSAGSACSSKKKTRPILAALHIEPEIAQSAIRISFGYTTTKADMDACLTALRTIVKEF